MWCGENPIDLIWRHGAGIRTELLQLLTTVSFHPQRPSATINHAEWHSDSSESWSTNVTEVLSWSEFLQIVKIKTVFQFSLLCAPLYLPSSFLCCFHVPTGPIARIKCTNKRESLTSQ